MNGKRLGTVRMIHFSLDEMKKEKVKNICRHGFKIWQKESLEEALNYISKIRN